jgi:tetratricopeptide (TPR) repeat protein
MMFKNIKKVTLCTCVILFVASQAWAQRNKNKNALSDGEKLAVDKNFLDANREKIMGNDVHALDLFEAVIKVDKQNAASYYEASHILWKQKKAIKALEYAGQAAQLYPDNEWYLIWYAELLQRMGENKAATKTFDQLITLKPNNLEYYLLKAGSLYDAKNYNEAITVYDDIEKRFGIDPDIIREKQRIWLKLGKVDKAATELEKLITKKPSESAYYILLVELYQANNLYDDALKAIKRLENVNPNHPAVALSYAEYYRSVNQPDVSFTWLQKAFANSELQSELKAKVLMSYLGAVHNNDTMMQQALTLSKIFAQTNSSELIPYAMYGDFLMMDKQLANAMLQYREAIKIDKNNLQVWQQLLQCNAELSDYKSLADDSKEAISLFPEQPSFYYFNGVANGILKNPEAAVQSLKSGAKLVVDNDLLLIEFYSSLGDNYHALKNYSLSDESYEKALKINPRNIPVLNNYAYYLSLRKSNLSRAAEMSKLSNELSPDNGTYQDTYAWVLFQQGNYAEAKDWQAKAIANSNPPSGTLYEHYGDILFKLGNIAEAVSYWKKAKEAGDYSNLLDVKISRSIYVEN